MSIRGVKRMFDNKWSIHFYKVVTLSECRIWRISRICQFWEKVCSFCVRDISVFALCEIAQSLCYFPWVFDSKRHF